jgi:hypothetical protein
MTYARVVIVLHLYSLEQCLNHVFWTSNKTRNFVTFYKFLIHLGMHHTYGKEITVAKNSMKTLHSVIARWTSKDKRKLGKSAETESIESKDKEDKGYCLDKGNNLLRRKEREEQRRNKDKNDN